MTRHDVRSGGVRRALGATATLAALLAAGGWLANGESSAAQTVAAPLKVEVAVVDRDGAPIAGLTPDKFDIEVGGRKRKVLGALAAGKPGEPPPSYVIAIDALTFGQGSTKNV